LHCEERREECVFRGELDEKVCATIVCLASDGVLRNAIIEERAY